MPTIYNPHIRERYDGDNLGARIAHEKEDIIPYRVIIEELPPSTTILVVGYEHCYHKALLWAAQALTALRHGQPVPPDAYTRSKRHD